MTAAITLEELLGWNREASNFWKTWLDSNPTVLELPCDIGRAKNVQEFVRHIWVVDLFWSRRIAGLPELDREKMPHGPLEVLFEQHIEAVKILQSLLADPTFDWDVRLDLTAPFLPPEKRAPTRRKATAHLLTHGLRHWAQLATLVRVAGFPSGFFGDLLVSSALE